ncbi:MAG: SDR family NAD(P)-dependent oxidoreductase [Phycisphaerae bacterium]|nr:SDR family NAD(P)-dependent oxidoreductase [Phycisphaerae bacterium]
MTHREIINTIAPALRVLLGRLDTPARIAFQADASDDSTLAVTLPKDADAPEAIVAALKESIKGKSGITALAVAGLGVFRASQAVGEGRVGGKVALVTGAAQGFGLEIAQALSAEGATVVLADVNADGAKAAARDICAARGQGRALGVAMNVTDEASIASALDETVRTFGGLDLLVSNAGVLKAGSVKTQPREDFEFVTAVNYTGYFLCVQAVAPILAAGHLADAAYTSDIIQINSKSGLVGSNRNGAYAGGKFGGIGLTQSFALELIEDGVKVNAICPGNFFDGPLWSDPQDGLFVQYLRTEKIPGAKSVADVRAAYEAKVPMKRGCTTPDVMKAVFYLIEQQYETGQAVPVTGGQVMLG